MTEQAKVPSIRFAGFTDPWEQRKLGELMDVASVRRVHQEDWTDEGVRFLRARDLVAFAKNESIEDPLFISSEMYKEYSAQSGKVSVGDLLVTGVGTIGVPWLVTSDNPVYFKDGNIIWFKNRHSIDGGFFYHSFTASAIQNCINEAAGIGTVGTYTIETGKKTPIWLPSRQEQREIAAMMTHLDTLITLHQRKYDKLVIFKKSMLEKMFPKDGESVPEIRFAGFTDPWEQRKLGEFGSVAMCKRIYKEQTSEQGDVPFFKIGTFGADPDAFISNELFEDYKRTYPYPTPGTLLISAAGSIGRIVEYQGEKAYFQDSNIVWLEHEHRLNDAFLKPLYSKIEWGLEGSTIKRLYNKDLLSAEVTIPDGREQKEIGQFFAKLDDLITLHQRKLELLRNIKKSLLDKMFV